MTLLIDLAILVLIAYGAYYGFRRGMALVGLELVSFTLATVAALVSYHSVGGWLKTITASSAALSNVAAFALIWIVTEIICALAIRFLVLPHIKQHHHTSRPSQISGAGLNAIKTLIMVALALLVFSGLPLSSATKRPVTESYISKLILTSTGQLQAGLKTGLGHDLGESLNFFTVTAEPESHERVELGFTVTTGVTAPKDEAAMLVLVNRERTSRGLKALTINRTARTVARAYSTDMFARGYFSHLNLEGESPFDRMKAGGVKFKTAGENLALAPTLQLAHDGLMNSPGHRANILKPEYRTVGIGIIDGGPYGLMVTQNFTD